jgi:hypothetical protein
MSHVDDAVQGKLAALGAPTALPLDSVVRA